MGAPWYTFNRIDNFGQIDPQGNYYKPDTNVLTPAGYPITALLSGVVTSVQRTGFGQTVVTIKLDHPQNGLATHTFFEHMHNATVSVGQQVTPTTVIGNANYAGEGANLGFGFYPGDVYGAGAGWTALQKDLAPGGAGLLNPVAFLNAARGGNIPIGTGTASGAGTGGATSPNPLTDPIGAFWSSVAPTLQSWGEYAAIFGIALVLIIIGFVLIGGAPVARALGKGVS